MQTIRAYSLALSALFFFACGDSEGLLTAGQAGKNTGPCIDSTCLPGLLCYSGTCHPAPPSSGTNATSLEPTSTGGTMDVTDTAVSVTGVTDSGTTTGEPPDATTGMVPSTTSMVPSTSTTSTTTGVEMTTVRPPDETTTGSTTNDSGGFIVPDGPCNGDMCAANESCVDVSDVPTCLATCDPLAPATCGLDQVCVPFEELFLCAPDASGPTGEVSDGCAYANGCDPGNLCLNGEYVVGCNGQACCSAFCDLDLADPCLVYGMQCAPWFEEGMAPPGHEDLGICIVL